MGKFEKEKKDGFMLFHTASLSWSWSKMAFMFDHEYGDYWALRRTDEENDSDEKRAGKRVTHK